MFHAAIQSSCSQRWGFWRSAYTFKSSLKIAAMRSGLAAPGLDFDVGQLMVSA